MGRAEAVTKEGLAATLLPGRQPDQMGQRHSLRPVRPRSCPGPLRNGSLCCISTRMWALLFQDAQRLRKETLKRQIRRAQSRVSAAERKRRTRRLILMGSYMEHVTANDPEKRDRLMKGLAVFLERDRDRELFDLPNKALTG